MGDIREAISEQVPVSTNGHCNGATRKGKKQAHALIFCVFTQAHFAAAYRLSVALAKKGITITFPIHERDLSILKSDELQGLDFNALGLADDPNEPVILKEKLTPFVSSMALKKAFAPYLEKLLADQKAGVATPTCIIADRFVHWTAEAAQQLKIPYYVLFSNGSLGARFKLELPHLVSQGAIKVENNIALKFDGLLNISGLPPLRFQDTPSAMRYAPIVGAMIAVAELVQGSDGVLMNTFYDFTSSSIDAIRLALKEASPREVKIFPIGPLSTVQNFKDKSILSGLDNAGSESLLWLDDQPPSSVLFICLGSHVRLDPPQIFEIASALEASQVRFLWVLPKGDGKISSVDDVLPPGYRARLQGRGKVVSGWVPQLRVLGHSSVGGFLTHCGWNSVIESTSMGVPMLSWPHGAEQHLNCRFLVTETKTAVEIGGDAAQSNDSGVVKAEEFLKAINKVMKEEEGRAMRERAEDLKAKAAAAVEAGGSSDKAFQEFVDRLTENHIDP